MRITLLVLLFLAFVETSQAGNPEKIRTADVHSYDPGLIFKENKGQWHANVLYMLETRGVNIMLERNAITYVVYNTDELQRIDHHHNSDPVTVHGHSYRVNLLGSQIPEEITRDGKTEAYSNYFLGNEPSRWATGVHGYSGVSYKNIYPGIDLKFYITNGFVKYDFIVQPGADASKIKLQYDGADSLILKDGHLYIHTQVGHVVEMAPVSFSDGLNKQIRSRYKLSGNELSFDFPRGYDQSKSLTIDPTLVFSTYTGSTADNFGFTATYDNAGNMYLGGLVNALSGNYPTTTGAFQTTWGGGSTAVGTLYESDMGITKFNPTGTAIIWSTYIGGANNDTPHSMFVNSLDQLVIYGRTYSSNFPVSAGAYDATFNSTATSTSDIVVVVLNSAASALIGSTYIGGADEDGTNFTAGPTAAGGLKRNYADDSRGEVLCDANNNIYIASCTFSSDFPTTSNAVQASYAGNQDGLVFKLNSTATNLIYSTYLGGTAADACYSLDIKSDATAYVAGGTISSDFPAVANGLNPSYLGGASDGFIVHLNNNASQILQSTFIGTDQEDQAYFVKLDVDGNVYTVGTTYGNYPIVNVNYSDPNGGQFITKLTPTLDVIDYSSRFGNGNSQSNLSLTAFLVDTCQNVYVCGWGGNLDILSFQPNNMIGLPVTSDAVRPNTDGYDFYIIVFKTNIDSVLYATYFGGDVAHEHVDGGTSRFDPNGVVYEAICASCGGLQPGNPNTSAWDDIGTPVTPGVAGPTMASVNCNALGFKMDMELYKIEAEAVADPAATGCKPLTVNFINNSSANASSFFWDLGTGNPSDTSNVFEPTFTYTDTGTYSVMLVAYSPTACVPYDTAYTSVIVYDTRANATFVDSIFDMCDSMVVDFEVNDNGPNAQFQWYVGDSLFSTDSVPSIVLYELGNYEITLVVTDTTACDPIDSFFTNILFSSRVETAMDDDTIEGCSPVTVQRTQHPVNATSWLWTFSDGGTSTDTSISRTYTHTGTYTITYTASNAGKCNLHDTSIITVIVYPQPVTATFTISQPTTDPQEYLFTNASTGATVFLWNFGDGSTSNDISPTHTFAVGSFDVCLTASNGGPCPATTCQRVDVVYKPVIDVPNAFSPTGDGNNDILYVRGVGVKTMLFRVFNRWGEKVFESNDLNIGWDGIYKDVPQEMDVYAWTLNALLDGDINVERKGNVTLVR